jgi:hypothetical protein
VRERESVHNNSTFTCEQLLSLSLSRRDICSLSLSQPVRMDLRGGRGGEGCAVFCGDKKVRLRKKTTATEAPRHSA